MSVLLPAWVKWVALTALALALYAFGRLDGARIEGAKHAEYVAEQSAELDKQRVLRQRIEHAWNKQLEEARNAAIERETNLRRAAGAARESADGLRDELAELRRRLPDLAAEACRVRADALAELFGACAARYRSVAESADRHAGDAQTLSDAWPQDKTAEHTD